MNALCYNEACTLDFLDPLSDVALADKAGFDLIELRFDCLEHLISRDPLGLDRLGELFLGLKIKPHALNALYIYPEYGRAGDSRDRHAAIEQKLELSALLHERLGLDKCVVVAPLLADESAARRYRTEEVIADCRRILGLLRARLPFMRWIFEPVGLKRSLIRDTAAARAVIDGLDGTGLVLDACNLFLKNERSDFDFSTLRAADIAAVHLMNGVRPAGVGEIRDQSWRRFCGDGNWVDLRKFLLELKKLDYRGMISTEVFYTGYAERRGPAEIITRAYKSLCRELTGQESPG